MIKEQRIQYFSVNQSVASQSVNQSISQSINQKHKIFYCLSQSILMFNKVRNSRNQPSKQKYRNKVLHHAPRTSAISLTYSLTHSLTHSHRPGSTRLATNQKQKRQTHMRYPLAFTSTHYTDKSRSALEKLPNDTILKQKPSKCYINVLK
jgi:hypothetical protein